jgi:putative transposase
MTYGFNDSQVDEMMQVFNNGNDEPIRALLKIVLNNMMLIERERHNNASSHERTEARNDYSNGFKPKTQKTRVGELKLNVPQTRSGTFYPSCLEKGSRSERALKLAIAEMYVQGVSTRKVQKIFHEMCEMDVTSSEVSRCAKLLDEELDLWRNRPLSSCEYLYLDARYEKVRYEGKIIDVAVLSAIGVNGSGIKSILGVSVSLSEAEIHWNDFFTSLRSRGLHNIGLIISDAHAGLSAARKKNFSGVPWQRCLFHVQQNAIHNCAKVSHRKEVCQDIRDITNAPTKLLADEMLKVKVSKWIEVDSKLGEWLEDTIPLTMTFFSFPREHWKKIRTNNLAETFNKELKRRTRVATLFPNTDSLLRLVSARAMETSEHWETIRAYIKF